MHLNTLGSAKLNRKLKDFFTEQDQVIMEIIDKIVTNVITETDGGRKASHVEYDYDPMESPLAQIGVQLTDEKISEFIDTHPAVDYSEIHNTGMTIYLKAPEVLNTISELEEQASKGNGIQPELFTKSIQQFLPGCPNDAIQVWIDFAEEIVSYELYVDFKSTGESKIDTNLWLETLLAAMIQIKDEYGEEIATQISLFSLKCHCIYPDEMPQAADCLMRSCTFDQIRQMDINGELEGIPPFHPKLTERTRQQDENMEMTLQL